MMDLRTMMTVSTLLLVTADYQTVTPNGTQSSFPAENDTIPVGSPTVKVASTSSPSQCAPTVGILTIRWISECKGEVELLLHSPSSISFPVCHNSKASVQSLLENVCNSKKGCKGKTQWDKGGAKATKPSYSIRESGAEEEISCETLRVKCAVEVHDIQGQLHAYKVVTALLCCVLLVLLLIRFTRPTVKALQKRLSDRRQNRWIGPTQSHSVSYHRGKAAVKNNDREMRLSYPALERLAVSDSREPSSNRNSGYNF